MFFSLSLLFKRYGNELHTCMRVRVHVCVCVSGLCEWGTGHFRVPNGYNFIGYGHYHGCSRAM